MTERESFEYWCNARLISHARKGDGYVNTYTDDMWDGWQARAELAATTRTQGADDAPYKPYYEILDALKTDPKLLADIEKSVAASKESIAQLERERTVTREQLNAPICQSADDAQPVAIYQGRPIGYQAWADFSEDAFAHMRNKPMIFETRIVYATRATPADHISQARDAVIEECAAVCHEAENGFKTMDRKQTASYLAAMIRALKSAPPEKPAGDVSDI
jgi:hypothetical protein